MTAGERRAMLRGSILLVLVGGLRMAAARPPAPAATAAEAGSDALPELLRESTEAADESRERGRGLADDEQLDPNRASEVALDRLPGVGPSTALAIVEFRRAHGGFRAPEELLGVRGIGERTLERIRPHLDFGAGVPATLRGRRGRTPGPADSRIPINSATESELQRISGIGPALSRRIVAHRTDNGPFRSLDELVEVPGIGPATLEKIRDSLRLGR